MAVASIIKTITVWLTEIIVKWKELSREYKILQLLLAELCGRIQLASQHDLAETFVYFPEDKMWNCRYSLDCCKLKGKKQFPF